MIDGVTGNHLKRAGLEQGLMGIAGQDRVDCDTHRAGPATLSQQTGCLDHGGAGGDDVIEQHRVVAHARAEIGQRDGDRPVARAPFLQQDRGSIDLSGHRLNPLRALRVRSDDHRPLDVLADPLREKWRSARSLSRNGVKLLQASSPVQMGVHRDEPIDRCREESSKVPCAHPLTPLECTILPHIGEIGSDQANRGCLEVARRCRREEQWKDLLVRAVERADDCNGLSGHAAVQPDPSLSVGKPVYCDRADVQPQRRANPVGYPIIPRKGKNHPSHRASPRTMISPPEAAYVRAYSSSPGASACSVKSGSPRLTAWPTWTCSINPALGARGAPASLATRANRRLSIWSTRPVRAAQNGRVKGATGGFRIPPCAWQMAWNFRQARPSLRMSRASPCPPPA